MDQMIADRNNGNYKKHSKRSNSLVIIIPKVKSLINWFFIEKVCLAMITLKKKKKKKEVSASRNAEQLIQKRV